MPNLQPCSLVLIKLRKAIALRRSPGFRARGINKADASRQDLYHSIAFEPRERTADRLDGEAEEIRDVLANHRQRYRLCRPPQLNQSIAPADQKTRDFLLDGTASEQDYVIPRLTQFTDGQFIDPAQQNAACSR